MRSLHLSRSAFPPRPLGTSRVPALSWILAVAVVLGGCARDRDPSVALPDGLVVAGDAAALARLFERAGRMGEAPVAIAARALAPAVRRCRGGAVAVASGGGLDELVRHVTCDDDETGEVGRGGFLVAWPKIGDDRVTIEGDVDAAGNVRFTAQVPASSPGVLRLFRSSGAGDVHSRLPSAGALAHAALDVKDGLPLPEVLPQAARAFIALVSDGSWELAVYPPAPGSTMLQAAFSFGLSLPDVAAAGLKKAVDESFAALEVHSAEISVGPARAVCLPELRVLPELAPCAAVVDARLVVVWNQGLLERIVTTGALRRGPSFVMVDFDRTAALDDAMAALTGAAPTARVPWSALRLRGRDGALVGCLPIDAGVPCEADRTP